VSSTPEQALEDVVRAGNVEACLAFFADMPEKERRKLAPRARQLLREPEENSLDPWEGRFAPCERVAVLATASLTEIRRFRNKVLPGWREDNFEPEYRTLENRRPAWLQSWCKWTLDKGYRVWPLVRTLVRNGACPPPDTDMYVLRMILGVRTFSQDWSVLDGLRDDPDLLENEVWRLFEIEGNSHATLCNEGEYSINGSTGWSESLRQLSNEGRVDRDRLLDASLAALNRDFTPYHARWFSDFHEYMQPTVEERALRTDQYLDLLTSPTLPIVSFAMRALVTIHKARQLDNEAFTARVEPALYATTKTPTMQALRILADIANEHSGLAARAVELAMVGLEHAQGDVQALALDIIERHGDSNDEALHAAIEERASLLAPSSRARAAQWLPKLGAGTVEFDCDDAESLRTRAKALPDDVAKKSGIDRALAELDSLTGHLPAYGYLQRINRAGNNPVRLRKRSFPSPSPRPRSPPPIAFRLARSKLALPVSTEAERKLGFVLRSIDDSFVESFERHLPKPSAAGFVLRTLAQLDCDYAADWLYQSFDRFLRDPDLLLAEKDVLILARQPGETAAGFAQYFADDLIPIIEDGRLDGVALGKEMQLLLAFGLAKPSRWVEMLSIVAAETPLHAQVVRNALETALARIPAFVPNNIHGPLELLLDLCVETQEGITNPDCRTFLRSFSGGSKAAKLARRLLALEPGDPRPHRRAAAVVALRGRLARAERWAGIQATQEGR